MSLWYVVLIESDWNLKVKYNFIFDKPWNVLIESDWNLKIASLEQRLTIESVLIESDWNLKSSVNTLPSCPDRAY